VIRALKAVQVLITKDLQRRFIPGRNNCDAATPCHHFLSGSKKNYLYPFQTTLRMRFVIRLTIFLMLLSSPAFMSCRGTRGVERQQRKIEKVERKNERQDDKEYEKAVKRLKKIQAKETRKMMKQAKKKSRAEKKSLEKKEFFLWRFLGF
jgi:hypothetical protein